LTAPIKTDSATEGRVIATEFQKPLRMPTQTVPMQAPDQAVAQAEKSSVAGRAKICPSRISSMDFSEVTTMV